MTPTDKSPLEPFWIKLNNRGAKKETFKDKPHCEHFEDAVQVIEASAHLAVKQELDAARARFDEANLNASKVIMDQQKQLDDAKAELNSAILAIHKQRVSLNTIGEINGDYVEQIKDYKSALSAISMGDFENRDEVCECNIFAKKTLNKWSNK